MSSSSSAEPRQRRRCRSRLAIALASIAVLTAMAPANAHQAVPLGPVTLRVEGAQLGDVATSGLRLTPSFTASTTDYVLRCHPGANTIGITLTGASGGVVRVGSQSGTQVSSSVTLEENQALVLEVTDTSGEATTSYWIRCLPSDFPALTVTKPGIPSAGLVPDRKSRDRRRKRHLRDDSRLERDAGLVPEDSGPGRDQRHARGEERGRLDIEFRAGLRRRSRRRVQRLRPLDAADPPLEPARATSRSTRAPPPRQRRLPAPREPDAGGNGPAPARSSRATRRSSTA